MVSPAAPAPATLSIPIDKGVKLSKLNNTKNKSVSVSAVSATLAMEPPPPLPVRQSSDGPAQRKGNRTNGASLSQPRNAPSPVILSIDASAQGFQSGGNSPLEPSPISFHAPIEASHHPHTAAPVQVTARFANSPSYRAQQAHQLKHNFEDGTYHEQPYQHQRHQQQPHYIPQQRQRYAQHQPTYTTMMPMYPTTIPQPYASGGMTPQSSHYYTSAAQPGYPTLVPIAMPGGYAMPYTPMMPHLTSAAVPGAPSPNSTGSLPLPALQGEQQPYGEISMDHVAVSQYQMQQYQAAMMNYMQVYGVQQQSRGGGGGGGAPRRYVQVDGMYAPPGTYLPARGGLVNRPESGTVQYHGSGSTGGSGPGSGNTSRNLSGIWSADLPLPGINDGPTAAAFQSAIRESGAMSSHERAAPEAPGEMLVWLKSMCASDGSAPALTLGELRGHMMSMCRDQVGSRVVQSALEGVSDEEVAEMFEELKPKLEVLIADQFGNYVIQRLLETGVDAVIRAVYDALKGHVLAFSLHVYGCRVVQKALEALPHEDCVALASELQPYTLHCMSDQNANHVIQKCIQTVQPSDGVRDMMEAIAGNSLALARHSFGCRSVQRLLQHCTIEEIVESVTSDVMGSILELTQNQFGNYVVQHLVGQGPEDARNAIMEVILPMASSLACHKFASNVMETCLKRCPVTQRDALIAELLTPSDPHAPTVSAVARDQYGNYVLQRALEVASVEQRDALFEELQPHLDGLRRSGYGKHIAARVAKMGLAKQRQQAQSVAISNSNIVVAKVEESSSGDGEVIPVVDGPVPGAEETHED